MEKLYDGEIVDAHFHLWDIEGGPMNTHWPWLKGPNAIKSHIAGDEEKVTKTLKHNYLIQDYLNEIKDQKVVKSVHVQAECGNPRGETEWLQSIADKHGYPHGIVAHANLAEHDLDHLLAHHAKFKNVRGIRQLLNWSDTRNDIRFAEKDFFQDPNWRKGYALLEKYHFSFDMHIWYFQMDAAAELIKAHPNIQVILDHTGMPMGYLNPTSEALEGWKAGMKKLAQLPNVACKLSAIAMMYHDVNVENFKPLIRFAIDTFGVDRCLFASNFPVDKMNSTYNHLFDTYKRCVSDLPHSDQKKLFHDNAVKFYRLK